MKITAITLQNVRRFIEPVRIGGFGAGLNVLAAPNEHGKSTFFDAIHAVFFVSHRSNDKTVKALTPRVGGDPEVSVEFEAEGAGWRLEKRWSGSASRKDAKLWRDGVLVAQKSEAEEQLSGLLKPPSDGGPAGLLWVRQGVVELESGGEEQMARRDIMTSVAGEVEAMTGGRRMETALAKCAAFLGLHLTKTGKSAQGGALKACEGEVDELILRRDTLKDDVRRLQGDLDRRRQVRRELEDLEAPEAFDVRAEALEKAVAGLRAAEEYDQKVQSGEDKLGLLLARADKADSKKVALQRALAEKALAVKEATEAAENAAQGRAKHEEAQAQLDAAQTDHDKATREADAAAEVLRLSHRVERAASTESRRKDLTGRIVKAEGLTKTIKALQNDLLQGVSAHTLRQLERLATDLAVATRSRDSAASAFSVTYSGAGKVRQDGTPVTEGVRHAVTGAVSLELDGIGQLEISPPEGVDDGSVAQAGAALTKALGAADVATLAAAQASYETRKVAEAKLQEARADLKAFAPEGVEVLREELAGLPEPVEITGTVTDVATAEAAEAEARQARDAAAVALEGARTTVQTLRETMSRAEALAETAKERTTRADQPLIGYGDAEASLQALQSDVDAATVEIATAKTELEALRGVAPDLATARAADTRARSVIEAAEKQINQLREERAALGSRIAVISSAALEEELALVGERLEDAQSRLARIRFDIAVYQRLQAALRAAQDSARENYVAAVHKELVPLLRMIWPDAEPEIDADTGLITAITRRGQQEDFEGLSGGTQEQISLLVRLAFARILAQDGRPAPVVLDDAIVYTDDDRIEQMFNALTRQSEDLQIIVFSCRQRAFRRLGGTTLSISRIEKVA
ncbi:AAA family ATPase [Shimia abyssi]|uniref:DNA repair exonuclease SbcCD ATPase subunit n=1 Tax=Shimia abyssi TaxID=1662395 RepID=A0A2P8F2U6_9RHOB|nr:AAA family ATPase [Shimia abyssi]PSL16047.1 DNA repair exonuclease SbcCD ATPase subunit [Shimia abyssi]